MVLVNNDTSNANLKSIVFYKIFEIDIGISMINVTCYQIQNECVNQTKNLKGFI